MRSNLEVPTFPLQHRFEQSLCGYYILAAGKRGSIDLNNT